MSPPDLLNVATMHVHNASAEITTQQTDFIHTVTIIFLNEWNEMRKI